MPTTRDDLREIALSFDGVEAGKPDGYSFSRNGRGMMWPFPKKVDPRKARVPQEHEYCMRVADMGEKLGCLESEPDVFFTTDHYAGYASVIVRLDAIDRERLREIVQMAWEATPLSTKLPEKV